MEEGKEALILFASLKGKHISKDEFINFFYLSVRHILTKKKVFHYVIVEDISDNSIIIKDILTHTYPCINSPCAYFFYNFAYQSFKSNKCFIIN